MKSLSNSYKTTYINAIKISALLTALFAAACTANTSGTAATDTAPLTVAPAPVAYCQAPAPSAACYEDTDNQADPAHTSIFCPTDDGTVWQISKHGGLPLRIRIMPGTKHAAAEIVCDGSEAQVSQ